ncbi:hypothetical protein MBLNU459_g6668t1 [Dothideomycetes sp. NU459]
MSTETVMAVSQTPKAQKTHKSKDSAKKSAKKRRHEEEQSQEQADAELANSQLLQESSQAGQQQPSSPPSSPSSKRQRTGAADVHMTVAGAAYTPSAAELDTRSPFAQQTTSLYLPLSPVCHRFALDGLCAEHLSPLLLTYYPPLRGVVLSYANPRLSDTARSAPASREAPEARELVLAKSINEYAVSFLWLTADFTLLRPTRGAVVEGYVSLQNESYLGLVCWNFFNAGIERRRLPKDWQWVGGGGSGSGGASNGRNAGADWMRGGKARAGEGDAQGHFVDGEGKKIEGTIRFRVRDFESAPSTDRERGFLSIEGTLLSEEEDKQVDAEVRARQKAKGKGGRRLGGRTNGTHTERPDS